MQKVFADEDRGNGSRPLICDKDGDGTSMNRYISIMKKPMAIIIAFR